MLGKSQGIVGADILTTCIPHLFNILIDFLVYVYLALNESDKDKAQFWGGQIQ